jgi:hypothetical protein
MTSHLVRALSTTLSLCGLLTGCGDGAGPSSGVIPTDGGEPLTFARDVQPIFDRSCSSLACHGGDESQADLNLEPGMSHGELVGAASSLSEGRTLVIPGDPHDSLLMTVLREGVRDGSEGPPVGRMPPPPAGGLSRRQLAIFEAWIAAGAPK